MPQPGTPGNAVIGQSGGPTAVINQSLVGAIEGLKQFGNGKVDKILGAHHAVRGIINNDFIDLTNVPQDKLDRIAATPSSALGSSRDKPDDAYCEKILKAFEQQNVRYFFYIGGNDSSDTCRIISEKAARDGYDLVAYHIPKTIDNDLVRNDHTPGFGSAAKFVAQAFMGDDKDNAALPGVKINIVMGRHAGFLTAASMMARREGRPEDGPHLIYVPEVAFSADKFIADVERVYKERGRCLIAVSEGIHDKDGTPMAAKLAEESGAQVERDAHGNVQLSGSGVLGDFLSDLIKKKTSIKRVRADTFGYLQRSFAGLVSEADATEARASAKKAAELALTGGTSGGGSVAIVRTSDSPYTVDYQRIELGDVAAKTKHMDTKYIKDGCDIDDSFRQYLAPILGKLPVVETF